MATVLIDGITTHYEVIGSGPPLLMFAPGGFDATLEKWSTLGCYARVKPLDHLSRKYTCILFDRRECGESGGRVERVTWSHFVAQGKGLLDHLNIDRAHLMGGCMGCCPAIAFAVAHPQATLSMVLYWPVGGARYRINGHERFAQHLAFVKQHGLQEVVLLVTNGGKSFNADPRGGPWASVIRHDRAFSDSFARQNADEYALVVAGMARTLLDRDTAPGAEPEDLLRLAIPALIIPGCDASHATSAARYLEECLPRAEYWDVPVAGQTEDTVAPRLLQFLEERAHAMIIDIHGHYTTEPQALFAFRDKQLAGHVDPARRPTSTDLGISDEALVKSVEPQLKFQAARGSDITIFSPRASGMAHHVGSEAISRQWTTVSNDLIHRICKLLPDRFVGVGQLPQFPGVSPKNCIPELERVVNELGFVGVNLNPDPSGGYWTDPPLIDRHWYPIYEKLCDLDVPAMIHVSSSCNPNFHATGAHYLNADTTAFMQLIQGNLFKDFPTLRFVIPHGGGAVPFHWGRYRGMAQDMKRPPLVEYLLNNVFFDTCVYHLPGIELLAKVIPIDNILFASEMIGAVKGVDPETGHYFDDTKRYIDQVSGLSAASRHKIFEGNARRVYPRLDALLTGRGL